jgi:hypothetical protein
MAACTQRAGTITPVKSNVVIGGEVGEGASVGAIVGMGVAVKGTGVKVEGSGEGEAVFLIETGSSEGVSEGS